MTSTDFQQALLQHDWYHDRSDDARVYNAGSRDRYRLLAICQQQPELFRLFNHADACIIRGERITFPTNCESTKSEAQTNTNTLTTVENIKQLAELLFGPLVKALDANTAAILSRAAGGCAAPATPAAEETAEVVTPAPKTRKKKEAEAPAVEVPAETPAAEDHGITLDDLKAYGKSISDDEKKKAQFLERLKTTHGVPSIMVAEAKQYPAILADLKKLGAVDSRLPVEAEAEPDPFA